jgi:hypothetical protein
MGAAEVGGTEVGGTEVGATLVGAVTWRNAVGAAAGGTADVGVPTSKENAGAVAAEVAAVEAVETLLYKTVPATRPIAVPPRTAVWVRRRFTKRS